MSLRDKMLAVIDDVNGSVAEREELVEMIAIALLTRKNLFVLGDPGQAKSYAINLFRQHIAGARQFERLLSKQTDEEQLFGRVDLSSLIPGSIPDSALEGDNVYRNLRFDLKCAVDGLGQMKNAQDTFAMLDRASDKLATYRKAVALLRPSEPVVQTVGKIPEADIVLLDEIFKCNDGVLNSLLTALNERKYTNEGHTYPIPTISFFAASNEIPNFNDPQEKILEALYDRLELKVVTANIEDRDTRLAVLKNKQSGAFGQVSTTITLEELIEMQREVAEIPVPDRANELADDILCELRKSMAVSDRKYLRPHAALRQCGVSDAIAVRVIKALNGIFKHQCCSRRKAGKLTGIQNTQKIILSFFVRQSVMCGFQNGRTDFYLTTINLSFFFLTWHHFLRFCSHALCGSKTAEFTVLEMQILRVLQRCGFFRTFKRLRIRGS